MAPYSKAAPDDYDLVIDATTNGGIAAALKHKRMIRFADRLRVRFIPRVDRFSENELNSYWYSLSEYKVIKKEISTVICVMDKADSFKKKGAEILRGWEEQNSTMICLRGLESRTSKEKKSKSKRRMKTIEAILDEQERQRSKGTWDEEKIARLYRTCTREDVLAAIRQGNIDQEEAGLVVIGRGNSEKTNTVTGKKSKWCINRLK